MTHHHHHNSSIDAIATSLDIGLGLLAFSAFADAVTRPRPPKASRRTIERISAACVTVINAHPAGVEFATLYAGVQQYHVTEDQFRAILNTPVRCKQIDQIGTRYFPAKTFI